MHKMRNIVVLALIFLFSLSSCKFFKEKGWFGKNKSDTLIVWQIRQDSIRVADSIRAEIQKVKIAQQAKLDSLKAIEEERLLLENRFRFHIIVGSFLTPEYAADHVDYYRSMGYDATIVPDREARFNLVSAEVHESLKEAMRRLVAYQDTVDFEAWLYIRN